jgi:hypothetical protein
VSPILGIIASSKFAAVGDFESIATVSVGSGGAASATFSSIPATYKHLQIRAIARSNRVESSGEYINLTFNSDSGANYAWHNFRGDGTNVTAQGLTNYNGVDISRFACTSQTTGVFGLMVLDVLDYENTNKYKTFKCLAGFDNNGDGHIRLTSGLWMNTNAITTITLTVGGGTLFNQYSSFALYGIKGA